MKTKKEISPVPHLGMILIPLFFLYCLFVHVQALRTDSVQIAALEALYTSTNGISWDLIRVNASYPGASWSFLKSSSGDYLVDPCGTGTSIGVNPSLNHFMGLVCTCDTNFSCDITTVSLANTLVSGSLPDQIGDLTALQHLGMNNNRLHGTIPEALFTRNIMLKVIDLSHNLFSGYLPPSPGGGNKALSMFIATNNELSGTIPSTLGQLTTLHGLFLAENKFTGVLPESFSTLTSLKYLHLYRNQLTGSIPSSWASIDGDGMVAITDFKLFENNLHGHLPQNIRHWSQLEYFQVKSNDFSGSPDVFSSEKMSQLKVIDISDNHFSGSLPSEIFLLESLEIFATAENCFSGSIPDEICNTDDSSQIQLHTLILSDLTSGNGCRNYYFGTDNGHGHTTSKLNAFSAASAMSGTIPECVYTKENLKYLYVSGNGFKGKLPSNLSKKLTELDLGDNRLTGTISTTLAKSNIIEKLYLESNRISGTLDGYLNQDNLTHMNSNYEVRLKNNYLSGTIPSQLFHTQSIEIVEGNTFQCTPNDDVPTNDLYKEKYVCGASTFTTQLVAVGVIISLIFSYFFLLWLRGHKVEKSHWVYKFPRRMKYWFAVGRPLNGGTAYNDTVADTLSKFYGAQNRAVIHFNTLRYCEYYESLRNVSVKMSIVLVVMLIVYGSMNGSEHRTLTHTYLWSTTSAYLKGKVATIVLSIFFILILFLIRYFILQDAERNRYISGKFSEEKKLSKVAAKKRLEDEKYEAKQRGIELDPRESVSNIADAFAASLNTYDTIFIPILRLIIITIITIIIVGACNVGYVYTLLTQSSQIQLLSNILLTIFNLLWQMFILPFVFWFKPLLLGVDESYHDSFITTYLGGKIQVLFIFQVLMAFFLPILAVVFTDTNCFNGVLLAPDPVKTSYNVPICTSWCLDCGPSSPCSTLSSLTIAIDTVQPFEYNYACASSVIKSYVPIFVSGQLIISAKIILYLCILLYEVIYQEDQADQLKENIKEGKESSKSLSQSEQVTRGRNDRSLSIRSLENRSLWNSNGFLTADERKSMILEHKARFPNTWFRLLVDLCLPSCPGGELFLFRHEARRLFWLHFDKIYDDATWLEIIVTVHMSNLLVLFTYGIFAPFLGLGIIVAICMESVVAQILAGRFIAMNSSILSISEKYQKKGGEEGERDVIAIIEDQNVAFAEALSYSHNKDNVNDNTASSATTTKSSKILKHAQPAVLTKNFITAVLDYDEPFGALSCLELAEKELNIMPKSGILYMGRRAFLWFTAIVFSFNINDIYFADTSANVTYIAQLFVLLLVPVFDVCSSSWGYISEKYMKHETTTRKEITVVQEGNEKNDMSRSSVAAELSDMIPEASIEGVNPLHSNFTSFDQKKWGH